MNERIQELADKIWAEEYWDNPNTDKLLPAQLNKFAQLIVLKCAEIADTERSNSVGCGYITKTNGMRIKEHFGVEE
jgi:hypothetical protein